MYEPEQRRAVIAALGHVDNVWLDLAEVDVVEGFKGRLPTKRSFQSRAFVITDRTVITRGDGSQEVESIVYRPGELFGHFLRGPGYQVALLSAKALHYDPSRQRWEKRLARYLSWQWRVKARKGNLLATFRIQTLIRAINERIDARNPGRTRQRFEKALDTLRDDGVIGDWAYAQFDEELGEHRGWTSEWLRWTVRIEPPEAVKDQYFRLRRKGKAKNRKPSPDAELLMQCVIQRRKQVGRTWLALSAELEIPHQDLVDFETGASTQPQVRKRLEAWVKKYDSRS